MLLLNYTNLRKTNTVIFLMGPTASGKSTLAIEIAKKMPVSIISVDSAMIYKGMDIGTAKPSKQLLKQYPHQLIDICQPNESYSCKQFSRAAHLAIKAAHLAGKIPLLVGGSGFYFKALAEGLSPLPKANTAIRKQLQKDCQIKGVTHLYQRLKTVDKQSAARLKVNDKQRIMRALEVFALSGNRLSELQKLPRKNPLSYPIKKIILLKERAVLHEIIDKRFQQMLRAGLLDEVSQFYNNSAIEADMTAMRSVGYRQVWQYFDGVFDYQTMVKKAIVATRQLCKRQSTWLRAEQAATILKHADHLQIQSE